MSDMMTDSNFVGDDLFFDSRDEVTSISDVGSDSSEACSNSGLHNSALGYEFWTRNIESVDERRKRFLEWMGLNPDWRNVEVEEQDDKFSGGIESALRLRDNNNTVLANVDSDERFFSGRSSYSSWSNETLEFEEDGYLERNLSLKIRNLDDGTEFVVDDISEDGMLSRLREVGSNRTFSFDEFQRALGLSPLVQQFLRRDSENRTTAYMKKRVKRGWISKLNGLTCTTSRVKETHETHVKHTMSDPKMGSIFQKVRVHSTSKNSKELSSLYAGQEFPAHQGSILTMKFSPDGQFLASAGKDGIVRVWKVVEDEILNQLNGSEFDPSYFYFSLNEFSKPPLKFDQEKIGQIKKLRKSSESTCVVLPSKGFHLLQKPIHEFHGHKGEVLALSWSKNNGYLLSSSLDETARLWQVGHEQCHGVYAHNNYVTCIDFNPVDDNYFISGSIDGKVRIWQLHQQRVVDWTDIKAIVTAVCFCPDGKGSIIGSLDGHCHFYDIIDNRLELGSQISLPGKKLTGKRITGFQFSPSDSSKVMVTSADAQVRILSGSKIVSKFKGVRHAGSQAPASFTPDGKHIVSASDDSNIYIWNYTNQDKMPSRAKNIKSCESFSSHNATIAIPWCGLKSGSTLHPGSTLENGHGDENSPKPLLPSLSDCLSSGRGFFLDSLSKGTATWPEEKLPNSAPAPTSPSMSKSDFKFIKSAFSNPNLWGLVIVTAGWDGCIRTFLNYGLPLRF
ncbi:hypothetical protein LIER_12153 [Lithospermum erythrorhizon]|uniref:Uncharacterized protein n=1 Tax=Lithospermum erythrorhizon TaxID=34254 RepID=A0AAV3PS55_LITER